MSVSAARNPMASALQEAPRAPFVAMAEKFQKARAFVNFWGIRGVEVDSRRCGLDALVKVVDSKIRALPKDPQHPSLPLLSAESRVAVISVTTRLKQLYAESDTVLKTANIFTRFFNFIFEYIWDSENSTRSRVEKNIWASIQDLFATIRRSIVYVPTDEEKAESARRMATALRAILA